MTDKRTGEPSIDLTGNYDWGEVREDSGAAPWLRIDDFLDRPDASVADTVAQKAPAPMVAEVAPKMLASDERSPESDAMERAPESTLPQKASSSAPANEAQPETAVPRAAYFGVETPDLSTRRKVQKLGIIGGRGVGKSYLFQAMVYRVQHAPRSGALSYFLDGNGIALAMTLSLDEPAHSVNLQRFNGDYERWTRLATTLAAHQPWYRLTLPYRTGLLGRGREVLEVEFFDGSGEQFFEAKNPQNRPLWQHAYADARVVVFCLPLWVAFPGDDLSLDDWRERERILESFHEVVQNYNEMRRHVGAITRPVRSILAFTMADDRRGALKALRERWIAGYLQRHREILKETRRGRGIARYLANARRVSNILMDELAAVDSPVVARIADELSVGGNPPWLIPVSAIHGEALDQIEADYPNPDDRPRRAPPVPIHVELPLLVALCEQGNALM